MDFLIRNIKQYLRLIALAAVCLSVVQNVSGQATSGNLVGSVTDPSGALVPGATVEATNTATNVKVSTVTGPEGQFQINNLPAGSYNLKVSHAGFNAATLRNVAVSLNVTATQNVRLNVGEVATVVEVTDTAAVIDTTTAQVSSTFQTREAIDTPASSLPTGVLNLSLLGAGVANAGGIGLGDGPSVGGQRPRNNSFSVEGVNNNRRDVTGRNVDIPNEAVAEFSMLQNQFSPEFGDGTGGQFNIVLRSGGNQVHGSLFEYNQNRNLNAVDQSAAREKILSNPRYDQNTFGGAIGGPIIRNKLFYYGLYQYNPTGQEGTPSSPILAPTAAGFAALSSMPGLSQNNLGVLKQYLPQAGTATKNITVNGASIPAGIVQLTQPSFTNITTYLVNLDYNPSTSDQIRGRFVNDKHTGFDTSTLPPLPAFFNGRDTTSKLLAFSEYHTFSPTLLNEFRFGYDRYNDDIPSGNIKFPGLDVFPDITVDELNQVQLGPYNTSPQSTIINTYQLIDNVVWTKGRHSVKFGWEGRKYIDGTLAIQRVRGDYEYSTLERFLLDQNPDVLAERNVGVGPYVGNAINQGLFFNDTYRMRPNFTITLGMRWDYQGIPRDDAQQALNSLSSVPGLIDFRKPSPQLTAFSPKIGLAYSPGSSGRTSIRAGFGIAYDKIFENLGTNSRPPQVSSTVDTPFTPVTTGYLAGGGIRPTAAGEPPCTDVQSCRDASSSYIYDQQLPYAISWNFGIQHEFHNDYTLDVRYLGTRGVHLFTQSRINAYAAVDSTHFLPTYLQMPGASTLAGLKTTLGDLENIDPILPQWRPYFDNSFITAFPDRGNSHYHGLAVELTRRFARGLLFKAAYTWSHNIDDSTADLFSTWLSPRRPQDFSNMAAETSSSFLDRRHRFTYNLVYDTPWFRSGNAFERYVLGGYTLSGTYTYESPQYATVQSGIDSNLNGDSAGDRTIVNPNGIANTGSGVNAIDRNGNILPVSLDSTAAVAYVATNPNAQYILAGYGALATGGRQTMAFRPIDNIDLQVKKGFNFTERIKAQLAVQFFNVLNHPQYVSGYINNVQFHDSNVTRSNLIPTDPLFNRPDEVFSSNPRTTQLTLRLEF
jgi:hypothetical protein